MVGGVVRRAGDSGRLKGARPRTADRYTAASVIVVVGEGPQGIPAEPVRQRRQSGRRVVDVFRNDPVG